MDEITMRLGLLTDAAQQQQRLAATGLAKLEQQLRDLDQAVREEVRLSLQGELLALTSESRRTAEALARARRAVSVVTALWSLFVTACCCVGMVGAVVWWLPSRSEIEALRMKRDGLAAAIASLEQRGAHLDVRRCGSPVQLCVRVDRRAPTYGPAGDYLVVKGS
jgi:hypothetical protein